ncbi:MAG: hypothetical protein IAG13_04020, partial [Deltaproteobacteria bacterium]|nr:hypothetical protein [Nannocystaceae bacterium]
LAITLDVAAAAPGLSPFAAMFSESTGRILFAARPRDRTALEAALGDHELLRIGEASVDGPAGLRVHSGADTVAELSLARLRESYGRADNVA